MCYSEGAYMQSGFGEDMSLIWVEGDVEALTFEDNSMDVYTIAFGIRNVTDIEKALAEALRLSSSPTFCALVLLHSFFFLFQS